MDNTFANLDGQLGSKLIQIRKDIATITETSTTTVNDILTYIAFSLAVLNLLLLCLIFVLGRHLYYSHGIRKPEEIDLRHKEQVTTEDPRCIGCNHLLQATDHEDPDKVNHASIHEHLDSSTQHTFENFCVME
ncbi:uncharacterized protein LOC116299440 [Actinia tenebrosa]|uniref:Uncharacterized protein LOC116299440 n=1 Tax=Actinia tenebrosa TaxID=6105 RepID=A0A6P8IE26_ACTTE|nr:uncharacterized protein LOC116299440 [Actinia tenebrosa]